MEGQLRWAGVDDHYFMSAALPGTGNARAEYRPLTTQDRRASRSTPSSATA